MPAMLLLRSCNNYCLRTALAAIIIMIFDGKIYSNCVAVIGLFSFDLCLGMVMYDNDFLTEGNKI